MFEPSDSWKQTNVHPERDQRYRPPPSNAQYESYRPDIKRESRNPSHHRRDSFSAGGSRWDHYEPDRRSSHYPSRSGSPLASPLPRKEVSRRSSRSSIASTHASDLSKNPSHHPSEPFMTASQPPPSTLGLLKFPSDDSSSIPGLSAKPPPLHNGHMDVDKPATVAGPEPPPEPEPERPAPDSIGDVDMDAVAPEPQPESRPISRASSRVTRSRAAAMEIAAAETEPVPEPEPVAAPSPPRSPSPVEPIRERTPSPPPVWEDKSKVLLQIRPLFPPDALPEGDPPAFVNAKSLSEALRTVVKTRMMHDRQPRHDVVNPVLTANQVIAASAIPPRQAAVGSTPDALIEEVAGGEREAPRMETFSAVRPSLVDHFERRQALIKSKVDRLSKEYLRLHDKWRAHCSALSDHQKANLHTDQEALLHTGRATRRTTAITDAVRSDLEMEQIIASLENNDAMDPNYLSMRNAATIPDMISVTKGQVDYLFDDTNHLVENPQDYYAPDTGIDDWTEEEKRIFIDKFAQYPKQFGIIAEYIPHKTSQQCVAYYYLHKKKQIDFRKVVAQLGPKKRKRRGGGKKKGNALLTDIAQHDAEVGKGGTSVSAAVQSFVVPSRVGKGRRGAGRPPKTTSGATPVNGSDKGPAAGSATATPQPEPRSARLAAQAAAALLEQSAPATPEPEGRPKRSTRARKEANKEKDSLPTSISAGPPVSQSASTSAPTSKPVSTISAFAAPSESAVPTSAPSTPAPSTPAGPSTIPLEPVSVAPLPPPPWASTVPTANTFAPVLSPQRPAPAPVPAPVQVAPSNSGSSGLQSKGEDEDATPADTTDSRPKRAPKRGRKQVKSVAIIHEEPPSPPPESAMMTPGGEASGGSDKPEPSMILTKATKALSEFEASRAAKSRTASRASGGEKGKGRRDAEDKKTKAGEDQNDRDLPEEEKNLFLELLVQYGLDFKRIALAMPGRSSHGLEKWYYANDVRLNEEWQRKVNVMTAAAGQMPVTIRTTEYPHHAGVHMSGGSTPPMGSLPWVHYADASGRGGPPPQHHLGAGDPSNGHGGQGSRPDYPMAIPYKPKGMSLSASTAPDPGFSPLGIYTPTMNSVHTTYQHSAYATPSVALSPYGYTYGHHPHAQPYYSAHTTAFASPYATTVPYHAAAAVGASQGAQQTIVHHISGGPGVPVSGEQAQLHQQQQQQAQKQEAASGSGETIYGPPGV